MENSGSDVSTRSSVTLLELAIDKGTGLAAEKGVLAIEKGTAWDAGIVKPGCASGKGV
jgi:hypothetical protein